MKITSHYNAARFFKPGSKKPWQIETDQSHQTETGADQFGESKPVRDILAEIHRILNQKSEPSSDIKQWLISAFEFLKKATLSTSSIKALTKRLQEENTPAAKAVAEAHGKANKLTRTTSHHYKHITFGYSFFKKPTPTSNARLEKAHAYHARF